jgi:hypothetical protein
MRPIKNDHSEIPLQQIFAGIQKTQVAHGAKRISFEHDAEVVRAPALDARAG